MDKTLFRSWTAALLTLTIAFLTPSAAWAENIPDKNAIRAIIGEAGGDGPEMMSAVAHGIRNRGTLSGVYGRDAEHVIRRKVWNKAKRKFVTVTVKEVISPELWQAASKAWYESEDGQDITQGADHWFSREDLQELQQNPPGWFKKLTPTISILGNFGRSLTFYRAPKDGPEQADEDGPLQ